MWRCREEVEMNVILILAIVVIASCVALLALVVFDGEPDPEDDYHA